MLLLAPQLPNAPLIQSREQGYRNGRAEQTKPPCAPPRRKDLDHHGCPWVAPDAAAGRALCAKRVYTHWQGGVGSQTLVASDLVPRLVQSFKLVTIPVGARAQI